MGTLYIIGNGFDLHFQLKTGVSDFKDYLKKYVTFDGWNALDTFDSYGVGWGEYEDSLADLELDELAELIVSPNYMSDHESDRDGGIVEMELRVESLRHCIWSALEDMVNNANNDLCLIPKQPPFAMPGDAILSFNYTDTIEALFDHLSLIPMLHIHGNYINQDDLIFGYCDGKKYGETFFAQNIDEYDYYIEEQKKRLVDFYNQLKKNKQTDLLLNFLSNISANKVVVLGHSMSNVDAEYMELIDRIIIPREWNISVYNNDPTDSQLKKYSFYNRIKKINITDIVN